MESVGRRQFVAAQLQSVEATQFRRVQIRHAGDAVVWGRMKRRRRRRTRRRRGEDEEANEEEWEEEAEG